MGRPPETDISGQTFGHWQVLRHSHKDKRGTNLWLCRCVCGNERPVARGNLTRGGSTNCGCIKPRPKTHGMSRTALHGLWKGVHARCYNKNHAAYHRYGGRGIEVCDRWHDFANFYADMGERPSKKHWLERLDNDGPYSPENCCWATIKAQSRNRMTNKFMTYKGETLCLYDWSLRTGIEFTTIRRRLKEGWPPERVLSPTSARSGKSLKLTALQAS